MCICSYFCTTSNTKLKEFLINRYCHFYEQYIMPRLKRCSQIHIIHACKYPGIKTQTTAHYASPILFYMKTVSVLNYALWYGFFGRLEVVSCYDNFCEKLFTRNKLESAHNVLEIVERRECRGITLHKGLKDCITNLNKL